MYCGALSKSGVFFVLAIATVGCGKNPPANPSNQGSEAGGASGDQPKPGDAGTSGSSTPTPTAQWTLTPLVEPIREHANGYADDVQYPNNICITNGKYGETPHSAFANTLSALWAARGNGDYVTAHTVTGRGGACLPAIDKAN